MDNTASARFTARKIRFGADVYTSEGERGTLSSVTVEPSGGAAGVGVRFGVFGREIFADFGRLVEGTATTVTLDAPRSALSSTQSSGVQLSSGTKVMLDGKRLGKLAGVTFDARTRMPRRIIIARPTGGLLVAPATALGSVDADTISLSSSRDGARPTVSVYRPDAELRLDIHEAIENYARMRVDAGGVDIQAIDGVVWLAGHVSSDMNRYLVEELSRGVPGVAELHNLLVTDTDLAASISTALARDPRTAGEHIGVYPRLGRVRLRGVVRTPLAREAASQIASEDPGAQEVVNDLHVDANASLLPALAGVTGNEDMVPGGE